MIRNLNASQKLYLLVFVMSAFIIAMGLYGIREIKAMNQNTQTLYADRVFPLEQLTVMRFEYNVGILLAAEQAQSSQFSFSQATQRIQEAEKNISINWKAYQLTFLTQHENELAGELRKLMQHSLNTIQNLKLILSKKDKHALDLIIKNDLYPKLNPITAKLNELIELQVKVSGDIYQNSNEVYNLALTKLLVFISLSLLFVIPFSYYLIRSIRRLIRDLHAGNIKIAETEDRFSKAFKSAPVAISATRLSDGTFFEVNEAMKKFLEYDASEIIGRTTWDLNVWFDLADRTQLLEILNTNGSVYGHDVRFRTKTGRIVTATYSAEVIELSGIPCILSVLVDITDRKRAEQALFESEKKYRNIFENVQDVFFQVNVDGIFTNITPSVHSLMGVSQEEMIGRPSSSIYYYPEDRETALKLISEKGEIKEFELYLKTETGEPLFASVDARLVKDDSGNITHIDGVLRNISQRRKAEEKLKQSEARLKEAQEIAHIGNWEIDMVKNIHTWSDELYNIFGVKKNEFQPSLESFLSFMLPDDRTEARKGIEQTLDSLSNAASNFRFFRKDGSKRYAHIEWRFEFDKRNQPLRLYGILQDITERKKAQESIKQSEANYRQLFKLSPAPMCVFDEETYQFMQVNQACISHYGYTEEEFANMTIKNITPDGTEPESLKTVTNGAIGNKFMMGSQKLVNKHGEILEVETSSIPVVLNGKNQVLMVAIDVTEKNQYEQKLTRAAIKAQEEERYEIGGELHDNVCQILATSMIYLGIMKKKLPEEANQLFDETHKFINMASLEIRNLSHRLAPAFFDNATLEDAFMDLLRSFNIEKKFEISLHFDELSKTRTLSRELQLNLYRILQEQLRNILKHAQASAIRVSVSTQNNLLQMKIADNGIGFDVESKKGGIGLANMNRRVQLFSGNFIIHSEIGNGSELLVEIPLS